MIGKKSKIIFVDHTPFVGGAQISLINQLAELNSEQFEFLLVCSDLALENGLAKQYHQAGIKYKTIPFGRLKVWHSGVLWRLVRSIWALRKIIKTEKPDLVVTNTVRSAILSALVYFLVKIKIIWLIRDFTFPLRFFSFLSNIPGKVVFNSQATASYYEPFLRDKKKKAVVYVGRQTYKKLADLSQTEKEKRRQQYAGADEILVAYIGRLVTGKGPQILVEAIGALLDGGQKKIKFLLVGTGQGQIGDNEAELKALVAQKGWAEKIIFTGHLPEVELLLPIVDILVLPSLERESFSAVVVEAMQAGVAVITANIGGMPEAITDGETGLLFAPGDVSALVEVLKKLINDKNYRDKIAQNAQKKALSEYTVEKTTRQLELIYQEEISYGEK